MESNQTDTLAQMTEGMDVEASHSRLFVTLVYGWKGQSEIQITFGLDDRREISCFLSRSPHLLHDATAVPIACDASWTIAFRALLSHLARLPLAKEVQYKQASLDT